MSSDAYPHPLKRRDVGAEMRTRLENAGGRPADLAAATVVFHFLRVGTEAVLGGTCRVIPPVEINPDPWGDVPAGEPYGLGWVGYTWTVPDLAEPGRYIGEWEGRWGTITRTFPNGRDEEFIVHPDIA